ncbi:hypothetical protein EYC80_005015 [Monilinia laxa]|uniref:Uncharacterized protein n=1 Tax=Monilinia laxa TaxID=61186 RepID=A0A5N6KKA5_MONLA|nr:hypothetical protein EYC80_005015 [Monilinia laxa]
MLGLRDCIWSVSLEKVWLHGTFASLYISFLIPKFMKYSTVGQLLFKFQLARDQNQENFTNLFFFLVISPPFQRNSFFWSFDQLFRVWFDPL